MKLNDLNFIKLLPSLMQDDEFNKGLSNALDKIFQPSADSIKKLSDWDRIDDMTDEELDELAWECNISWYDKTADLETKRRLCKNSDRVFMTRATASAVEEVISTYFSEAKLREHFEKKNGRPHYFKVACTDPTTYNKNLKLFLNALEKTKRKSQWLEAIVLILQGKGTLYIGTGMIEKRKTTFDCRIKEKSDV